MAFDAIPDWLGGGVLAAAVAALGFVGKQLVDLTSAMRAKKAHERARLLELASLLKASRVLFLTQRVHAEELAQSIAETTQSTGPVGLERSFVASFAGFDAEQRDLHALVRGITVFGMRPVNEALSSWLKSDTIYRVATGDLARSLQVLEAHLLVWHAKYGAWIPDHPEHALVYLADEERHGVGFPRDLDGLVEQRTSGPKG